MHGFALNINNDLRPFEYIYPCGIKGAVMTSVSKLLGQQVEMEAVVRSLLGSFSEAFGLELDGGLEKWLNRLNVRVETFVGQSWK
jgi:lipoyl(octanoyl) transferase